MTLYFQADRQDRVIGAYLGLAIGDALGATTEFMTPDEIQYQYGVHDTICGGGWLRLQAGQVTDDTEMSLALGQSIIENNGIVPVAVARAFSDWMHSKPVDIGNTVRRGIVNFRGTGEPQVAENKYDAGNGACMRTLPVAIFHCHSALRQIQKSSRAQTHVTHNNRVSDAGTETIVKMLIAAFNGQTKNVLQKLADELVTALPVYQYNKRELVNPSAWIVETLQVVFQAFFRHDNFRDILLDVVNRGGDADTTGAIAGMLAGACYGQKAVPVNWFNQLDYQVKMLCINQALDLMHLAEINLAD